MWRNEGEMGLDSNGADKATNGEDDDHNGYVDDVLGWNFSATGNPQDPADVHGHGTHVAGTIAGNGSGVRTGIAPQAKIMALRETDTQFNSTEQECWQAMEYATSNRAKILNFSSGWMGKYSPDYTSWRRNVQNATDAGVLFVTVAGDVGKSLSEKPPYNVTTPGRVPAALTVGSCAWDDSIPQYSCRGPVTWPNAVPLLDDYPNPPGLLKPDLVAPGENIKSTQKGGGYVNMSGTSMAAPHVAGVAALLLTKYPELNPYDVRFILEETAINLNGTGQPDVSSGWGLISAKNALNYTLDSSPYDLSAGEIRVERTPEPGKPALVSARLKNLGGQVVGNAELRFYFADAESRSVTDLDPNGDGMPDDANFTYIGSWFVPVLGPKGSKHESFEGVVRWTAPATRQKSWWIGVWALPGATADKETNPANNGAVFQIPETGGN
jgi:subtilisin family serine protease